MLRSGPRARTRRRKVEKAFNLQGWKVPNQILLGQTQRLHREGNAQDLDGGGDGEQRHRIVGVFDLLKAGAVDLNVRRPCVRLHQMKKTSFTSQS